MTVPVAAERPPRRWFDLRSKRFVLIGLLALVLIIFGAGMGAAWSVRHKTFCQDGKPPVAEKTGAMLPTIFRCHNGQITTLSQG